MYERIVHFQFMAFLEKHNLLDDSQHGIHSEISVKYNKCCSWVLEPIIESIDRGDLALSDFVNLWKAFDRVEHSIMIEQFKGVR